MKNHNGKMDRSKFHSRINFPASMRRRCVSCGCIQEKHNNKTTYEINGVVYDKFIECIKPKIDY